MSKNYVPRSSLLRQPWPASVDLSTLLKAGAVIAGTDTVDRDKLPNSRELQDILLARLQRFDEILSTTNVHRDLDEPSLKLHTANASLYVLERVQAIFSENEINPGTPDQINKLPPMIGTKDIGQLRTHTALFFKWGSELLLARVLPTLPNKRYPRLPPGAQIIDLTTSFEDYIQTCNFLNRVFLMIFPDGPQGRLSQTLIALSLLNRNVTDLLRPCICLGWLPDELRGDLPPAIALKAYSLRLLASVPPSQTIASLGNVLSSSTALPSYVKKICSRWLCLQLLRPHGVAGMFSALLGEDISTTEAPLERLERAAKILTIPPAGMPPENYFILVMPRLVSLLSPALEDRTPPAHKRAAAFCLSRILTASGSQTSQDTRRFLVSWLFHVDLIPSILSSEPPPELAEEENLKAFMQARKAVELSATKALMTIATVLANTDPSPEVVSALVCPIAPHIYSLSETLKRVKTADPTLKEIVDDLLITWTKAAPMQEVVDCLWSIVRGQGTAWKMDDTGDFCPVPRSKEDLPTLTLAQHADLREGKLDFGSEEENPLGFYPNPFCFTKFLKMIDREDVSSELYMHILDAHAKANTEDDPLRKLLLFKLVVEISSSDIGGPPPPTSSTAPKMPKPAHILSFIKMALDRNLSSRKMRNSNSLEKSLRIAPEQNDSDEDSDSDGLIPGMPEIPGLEGVEKSKHLNFAAINLLLALLQETPDLIPQNEPLLNVIYNQLEPLSQTSPPDLLTQLARDARLTLYARMTSASLPAPQTVKNTKEGEPKAESAQATYQRALKLLQDPILPVRAHGLLILRELVSPKKASEPVKKKNKKGKNASKAGSSSRPGSSAANNSLLSSTIQGQAITSPSLDPAYAPSIMSIFIESVQDEDSYIYMNAVQGLSAMVDGWGKDVLTSLVNEYTKTLQGVGGSATTMTQLELDKRVRIGEALSQVIRRCGGALGNYVSIIIPPLSSVIRGSHLPTTLRTSAISILGTAASTDSVALTSYMTDLISAMIDLVQVESVPAVQRTKGDPKLESEIKDTEDSGAANITSENDVRQKSKARLKGKGKKGGLDSSADEMRNGDGSKEKITNVPTDTMDSNPTAAQPKYPPLRRSALYFLELLIRSLTHRVYDGEDELAAIVPGSLMKRGTTVLSYVAATDMDGVVQVMAQETVEQIDQLKKALLGL